MNRLDIESKEYLAFRLQWLNLLKDRSPWKNNPVAREQLLAGVANEGLQRDFGVATTDLGNIFAALEQANRHNAAGHRDALCSLLEHAREHAGAGGDLDKALLALQARVATLPTTDVEVVEAPPSPETIWKLVLGWLRRKVRYIVSAVVMTLIIGLALGFEWMRISVGAPSRFDRCLAEGRRLKRPYVLASVTALWTFSDNPTRTRRNISTRTTYVVWPLRPFSSTEQNIFEEEYGHDRAEFLHWFGAEQETFRSTLGRSYFVQFSGTRGEPRTVVTGAEFDMAIPLEAGRPGFVQNVTLGLNEEFWRYPNSLDVVCEFTMIVQSPTTTVHPIGFGGARLRNRVVLPVQLVHRNQGQPRQQSLTLRWQDTILPGDDIGVHFGW